MTWNVQCWVDKLRSGLELGRSDKLQGTEKDARKHRTIEAAGICVAEGGVVAAKEGDAVRQEVFDGVAKGEGGAALDDSLFEEVGEIAVPCDLAEADDDADFGECGDFGCEVNAAVADLLRGWLIAGRGAADDRADPELAELEAILAVDGDGFAGKAELVEHGIHEVAGAIAGEGAAGAVGSVGSRS